eukprot:10041673-Lingulodinium_polyedra.AAC.1
MPRRERGSGLCSVSSSSSAPTNHHAERPHTCRSRPACRRRGGKLPAADAAMISGDLRATVLDKMIFHSALRCAYIVLI